MSYINANHWGSLIPNFLFRGAATSPQLSTPFDINKTPILAINNPLWDLIIYLISLLPRDKCNNANTIITLF